MWGISFVLFAAFWAAGANLCMRKNQDFKGSTSGYLIPYYLSGCLLAWLGSPSLLKGDSPFSSPMFLAGGLAGALNVGLLQLIGRALTAGPAGLTFAFVSAASLIPSLLMPLVFGKPYGFLLTTGLMMGQLCILAGLFWSAKGNQGGISLKWLICACSLLVVQGVILCLMQWQCLIMNPELPSHPLLFVHCSPQEAIWFMPGMFTVAFSLQLLGFLGSEKRKLRLSEIGFGSLGGLVNGMATLLLLSAAQWASPLEKGIMFPCYAMATILLCNLWGFFLYQEKVHWKANALCSAGIVLGAF